MPAAAATRSHLGNARLGLPDAIRACLFDLDGVLDTDRQLHAAAWKQMFDDFLGKRAPKHGRAVRPVRPRHDYDRYVDGLPRSDGVRSFLDRRDGIRRIRRTPRRSRDWATARTSSSSSLIREQGVEPYEGSVRYVQAVAKPGCAARSSPRARTAAPSSKRRGCSTCSRRVVDGVALEREQLKRKAGA